MLQHAELTEKIIGAFYAVYNELGPGFLESVYKRSMAIALNESGLKGRCGACHRGAVSRPSLSESFEWIL